ncbi:MAG TPA: GNAT family N-acetyltransferase [Longimicrobiaceae bacterium]|jgi:RimJ/RimL family protein N-acetyltransferase
MGPIWETERLRAREMQPADLDFVAAMLAHREVMRFYPRCYTRDEARGWLERQVARYREHGHALWLIEERAGGEPVGQVGLVMQQVNGRAEPEVGYLVHRPFWRRGYATEAALATRDHAFGALGLPRVVSLIRPENLPSQGVARKLGMRPEGTTTHAGTEHVVFAVSRADLPGGGGAVP